MIVLIYKKNNTGNLKFTLSTFLPCLLTFVPRYVFTQTLMPCLQSMNPKQTFPLLWYRLCLMIHTCCLVAQLCLTFHNPMDCNHQAPLSMEFSSQEYWSSLPFPSAGELPDSGIKSTSPALVSKFCTAEPAGLPMVHSTIIIIHVYVKCSRWTQCTEWAF